LEVKVHRSYDEYPMSQTSDYGSYPGSDAQRADTKLEHGLDDNVEGIDEKI